MFLVSAAHDRIRNHVEKLGYFVVVLGLLSAASASVMATYYASPTGSGNVCSIDQPGSLSSVQALVKTRTSSMSGDIVVNLRGGRYGLSSTFTLGTSDGGSGNNRVIYQAYAGEKPVISGGMQVTSWTLHDAGKNIYKATVGTSVNSRQLYVNGVRATRARSVDGSGWYENGNGFDCPSGVASWGNVANMEMVSYAWWKCKRGPIASISGTHAVMANPYWNNAHIQAGAPASWVENAYELLDVAGEWYLNHATGVLYYKPKSNENINTAEIILAKVEKLISASYVNNLQLKGITFSHSTWLRPSTTEGLPCWQADFLEGSYVMPGDIVFDHTTNLLIQDCTFEHLGTTALLFNDGCKNDTVYNSTFQDISGSGIAIGNLKVRNPSASELVKDIVINNNLIQYAAVEYRGCVGIIGAYIEHAVITHNSLRQLPYSGISVGWGWTTSTSGLKNNIISYNRIDTAMSETGIGDGGSIYTLSKQPGSRVEFNYVNMIYRDYTYGLYADQGTSNMRWQNNVLKDCAHWLDIWTSSIQYDTVTYNYYSNNCGYRYEGTNCVIENNTSVANYNWPAAALTIIANAGRAQISTSPTITSSAKTSASVGTAYTYTVSASGNPTPTFSASGLPSWLSFNASTATFSGTPTVAGTTGTITVTATNSQGNTSQNFTITVSAATQAPSVPTLSSPANNATGQSINLSLSWNSASGATSYQCQVSTSSGFSSTVYNQSGITYTSVLPSGLGYNTPYYWRVNASNANGTSAWSSTRSFTTVAGTAPAAPPLSSPTANATGISTTPTLSWSKVNGAISYGCQVSTVSGFASTVFNQSAITGTSVSLSGLANNTTYYWRANATNSYGTSGWSTNRSFTTAPSGGGSSYVFSTGFSGTQGANQWYYKYWNGSVYTNMTWDGTKWVYTGDAYTQITSSGIHPGTSNDAVIAWLVPSGVTSVTISGNVNDGNVVDGDGVVVTMKHQTTTIWGSQTIANGNTTGYNYNVTRSVSAGDYIYLIVNDNTNNGWDMTNLTLTITTNGGGGSVPSAPSLSSPANAATGVATSPSLTWGSVSGATAYNCQVSTTSGFGTTVYNGTALTGTTGSPSGLANNTVYYWRVNAYNSYGTSSWSSTRSFTTAPSGGGTSYVFSTGFSGTQGANQWYYKYWNGSAYANMTWNGTEWEYTGDQYSLITSTGFHPGTSNDAVIAWLVPSGVTSVTISGNVNDGNVVYGDGVIVTMKHRTTTIWGPQTITNGNTTGYNYNVNRSVSAGDYIYLIVNDNTNNGWDMTNVRLTIATN